MAKICLHCKSSDLRVDFSNHAVWGYGLPPKYECNSCGNVSEFFIEVDEEDLVNVQKVFNVKTMED